MQQVSGTRTQYCIELDKEKIALAGVYDYSVLVEFLDTELAKHGFNRKYDDDGLCYYNDAPNSFFEQMACYLLIVKQAAIYNNLKKWQIMEFENGDFSNPTMVEDVLETIAKHGGNPLWSV